jgi:hypothetical protein
MRNSVLVFLLAVLTALMLAGCWPDPSRPLWW